MIRDIIPNETRREKAMRLFLEEHQFVEALAYHLAPTQTCHGDIINDVFMTFVQNNEKWDIDSDIKPLLAGITRKIAKRYWQKHLQSLPEKIQEIYRCAFEDNLNQSSDDSDTNPASLDDQLTALDLCMKKLTDKCSTLIRSYYLDKLSYKEIASQTGQKVSTLQKTMFRLRQALRVCIENILKTGVDEK